MGFAIGGAILGGALLSSNAAQNAASTQAGAANYAAGLSNSQFNTLQTENAPWLAAGQNALGTLQSDLPSLTTPFSMSDFTADPGYQFTLQQGEQAIQRSAAASGGLDSGAAMEALNNYAQGAAGTQYEQAYNNYNTNQANTFNRLASVAGLGQTAVAQNASAGANNATTVGNAAMGAANAQAAGTVGSANAINSAVGTGMNTWMNTNMMNKMFPSSPSSTSPAGGGYGQEISNMPQYTMPTGGLEVLE